MTDASQPQITITGPNTAATLATFQPAGEIAGLQTRMTADISISQIASVSTAYAEKAIRTRLSDVRGKIRPLQNQVRGIRKDITSYLDTFGNATDDATYIILEAELRQLFDCTNFHRSYDAAVIDLTNNRVSSEMSINFRSNGTIHTLRRTINASVATAIREGLEAAALLDIAIKDLQIQEQQTLNALSNVDTLEKAAIAKLTESTLRQSVTGQQLIADLESRFEDEEAVSALIDSVLNT